MNLDNSFCFCGSLRRLEISYRRNFLNLVLFVIVMRKHEQTQFTDLFNNLQKYLVTSSYDGPHSLGLDTSQRRVEYIKSFSVWVSFGDFFLLLCIET